MRIRSIRREMRLLRIYAVVSTLFAAVALLGAAAAVREVSFDTLTVHRINIMDREGKLAMVIASHDDAPAPIVHGYRVTRQQGNNTDNGIILFNNLGDEQGGLSWHASADRSQSGDYLSFDTANTDQLIHVEDGDENGRHYAQIVGWDRAPNAATLLLPLIRQLGAAKTADERAAVRKRMYGLGIRAPERFRLGYGRDGDAVLVLSDKSATPRIKLFVTPSGDAKLQFLDAAGRVTAQYPK